MNYKRGSAAVAVAVAVAVPIAITPLTHLAPAVAIPPANPMVGANANVGGRLEIESERTAFQRVYANPDGSRSSVTSSVATSTRGPDGMWRDIDNSLVTSQGHIEPAVSPHHLELSPGGTNWFARHERQGELITWSWPQVLPEPELEGNRAIYRDVEVGPSADLIVAVVDAGLQFDLLIKERPQDDLEVPITIKAPAVSVSKAGAISIDPRQSGDSPEIIAPPAAMWSQETPTEPAPVAVESEPVAPGETEISLVPDHDWLRDPDTKYPVVVDPTFVLSPMGERTVSNAGVVPRGDLTVGTDDGGQTRYRSFLKFNANNAWHDKTITSASLKLRNSQSLACRNARVTLSAVSGPWSAPSITWANQQGVYSAGASHFMPSYGGACPVGNAEWNVRSIVQNWANGTWQNEGFRLRGYDETTNASWRRYRSSAFSDANAHPTLTVTYFDRGDGELHPCFQAQSCDDVPDSEFDGVELVEETTSGELTPIPPVLTDNGEIDVNRSLEEFEAILDRRHSEMEEADVAFELNEQKEYLLDVNRRINAGTQARLTAAQFSSGNCTWRRERSYVRAWKLGVIPVYRKYKSRVYTTCTDGEIATRCHTTNAIAESVPPARSGSKLNNELRWCIVSAGTQYGLRPTGGFWTFFARGRSGQSYSDQDGIGIT